MRICQILSSFVGFVLILATAALASDYGRLLDKRCSGRVCYLRYEGADVWTRNGKPFAYHPVALGERREAARLLEGRSRGWTTAERGLWHGFIALQTADVGTTAIALVSHRGHEANPLLGWAFKTSTWLGLGIGVAGKTVYSLLLRRGLDKHAEARKPALAAIDTVSGGVVLWNILVLLGVL